MREKGAGKEGGREKGEREQGNQPGNPGYKDGARGREL